MRPLARLCAPSLLLLALAAAGCKSGCDEQAAQQGGAAPSPALSTPDRARFGGGSNTGSCPGGNCSAAANAITPPEERTPPRDATPLPAFREQRVADASVMAAPAEVQGRAVTPPPAAAQGETEQPGPPPPAHSGVRELRTQAEFDAALRTGTPMVVKWYGPRCGPCKVLAPAFEDAARELDGQVAFYSVNSHGEGAPNIPQVQSLPGLAYYEGGRLLTHRSGLPAGVRAREALKAWLINALANRSLQ